MTMVQTMTREAAQARYDELAGILDDMDAERDRIERGGGPDTAERWMTSRIGFIMERLALRNIYGL